MKKKLGIIKLKIISGKATAGPPIGPALGQRGLNIIEFCKNFNSKTNLINPPILLPVLIIFYENKTYDFIIKKPYVSVLLKNIIEIEKFSTNQKFDSKIFISSGEVKNILRYKLDDFNSSNLYSCFKIILGVFKSMGVFIKN